MIAMLVNYDTGEPFRPATAEEVAHWTAVRPPFFYLGERDVDGSWGPAYKVEFCVDIIRVSA
jgi:hypothetical protein